MNTTASSPSVVLPFSFNDHLIRTVVIKDDPWFVAKDVCDVLGYGNPRQVMATHLDDDEKGVQNLDTPGGRQEVSIISESGLYTLIIRSNKQQARQFRKWVTAEVLPQIRKTGSYSIAQRTTHLLESEVKEGAHLLGQVIGRVSLSDRSRWQLVDRLFHELFGKGVEMLGGGLERLGKTEERYFRDIPILMINLGEERDVYIPRIMMLPFTDQCCNFSAKVACSQAAMYSVFRRWWLEYTDTEAPELHILRRSLNCRAIDLLGEPWFVGVEPKEEVRA